MNADVIKSFLVSLGFDVDSTGEKKFNATLAGVTMNAVKAGVAIEAAALSVVAYTARIASGLDQLYQVSQRTGASAEGIQKLSYAISQAGGSASAAKASLEGMAAFMRNNPGAEGFMNRLGIQTRDAKGNMRDMATIFTSVGQKLSSMPFYRARQYAQMLGIDDNTLMAMRRGLGQYSEQYSAMAKAIGFDANKAAASSNKFMTSLKAFGTMAGMARDKIGADMAGGLTGSLDRLRKQFLDNFPKIETVITRGVKGIMWLADMVGHLVYRLIDGADQLSKWWGSLDKSTKEFIELLGALTVALRVLNMEFWRSPIGIITALAAAIFLLWDDYQTWKEGGKSLIDWGKWKPDIDSAMKNIKELKQTVTDLKDQVMQLLGIDPKSWSLKWDMDNAMTQMGEFGKMLGMIADLLNAINEGHWKDALSISKKLMSQGSDQPGAMPEVSNSANSAADSIKNATGVDPRDIGGWFRARLGLPPLDRPDSAGEPEQHAQSAKRKRPQPTQAGAVLLNWMQPAFSKLEQLYRLPEGLLRSVAITESGGNQFAVSGAGAKGLFQFMDGTARGIGLRGNDVFDPVKSAQAAAKYLAQLLKANGGDLGKALASYNWGIGNVQRYGMALMPQETRQYIPRVMSNMPGAQGPVIQQETNINIHGVTDPHAAGKEVADRQEKVNSRNAQELHKRVN
ncbi:TPA: transglycosylase SLT domain-containing protein [Enterobacter ludwigii]|nr:transglycosylase SLT domain-containing protein [Enterobacter ludwigii]HDR2600237.1 transglycosylase SLT domain-containing protein [Enterobacter ludwigii]